MMDIINFLLPYVAGPRTDWQLIVSIFNIVIALCVLRVIAMIFRLSLNKLAGVSTKPFSRPATGKRILILGDSTAVGTGARHSEDTIAGRLAKDFPTADITNVALNGGLVRDLHKQIKLVDSERFDLIIVSVGGNDVWHLTRISQIEKHLHKFLPMLQTMCNKQILFLIYNNMGEAPLFPNIMRGFLRWRCDKVQAAIKNVTALYRIPTVSLFSENEHNPFIESPKGLFAPDGVHPSSEGYKLWYYRLFRKLRENVYSV